MYVCVCVCVCFCVFVCLYMRVCVYVYMSILSASQVVIALFNDPKFGEVQAVIYLCMYVCVFEHAVIYRVLICE